MSPPVAGSDVRHSSHVCLPFENDDEKHEATVAFIHEGLSRGARCMFLGTKDDFDELGRSLEDLGICTRRATARGALQYRTVEEVYLYGGIFDPPRALDHTDALIDAALVDGFTGLRLTAELTRIPAQGEWQKIVWYDAMMNERFARRPIALLCRYPRTMIPAERVRDVLRTHPVAIVRGEILRQSVLRTAEIVLRGDAGARCSTGSSGSFASTSAPGSTWRARGRRRSPRRPSWPSSCTICGPGSEQALETGLIRGAKSRLRSTRFH